jgi:hypothetical protein
VDPRAGLGEVEKRKFLIPPGFELRPLGRPVRSKSLYRLRYPGSSVIEHLQNVTTSNYSVIANSLALQFTTARTTSSLSALSTPVVAW